MAQQAHHIIPVAVFNNIGGVGRILVSDTIL